MRVFRGKWKARYLGSWLLSFAGQLVIFRIEEKDNINYVTWNKKANKLCDMEKLDLRYNNVKP